jgi:hypothetical protein
LKIRTRISLKTQNLELTLVDPQQLGAQQQLGEQQQQLGMQLLCATMELGILVWWKFS